MVNKIKEIRAIFSKKFDDAYFNSAVSIAASLCNRETFGPIKCVNKDYEVALCGAGPTFEKYVPMEGVKHVALNRALLNKKIKFDWFIADDWDGIKFLQKEIMEYDCMKFFGHQIGCDYIRQIPESFRLDSGALRYYTDSYMLGGIKSRFICDIDRMAIGNMPNIALSAMQIVLFSRPKKIYLVGCDASQGHFIKNQQISQEMEKQHEKDLSKSVASSKTIQKWIELKEFAACFYPDIEIISINPVGLKGIFKDVYQ